MKANVLHMIVISMCLATSAGAFGNAENHPKRFACGAYVIEVSDIQHGEESIVNILILDKKDQVVFPQISEPGTFVSLCKQNTILVLDTNTQYGPGPSFLLSNDAKLLMREEFGEIDDYGKSDDDKIFWVQSRDMIKNVLVVEVKVYSYQGELLGHRIFSHSAVYAVQFQGKKYEIKVIQPDYPG